jgi:hypothetical protein
MDAPQQQPIFQNQSPSTHGDPQQQQRSHVIGNGAPATVSFPQYFPVYDYRTTRMTDVYASNAPVLDVNPMPGGQRRASGSPEGNMQSSIWQDFVDDLMT